MNAFQKRLHEKLEFQLKEANDSDLNVIHSASKCVSICQETIEKLKKYMSENPPKDIPEEIYFFKEVLPKFYSQFIYYVKVFNIETNRPTGSDKVQRKYLEDQLHRIKLFFDNNLYFYHYYRTGATHFDEVYFSRSKQDIRLVHDTLILAIDNNFYTIQSLRVAKLFANELLLIYLNNEIADLDRRDEEDKTHVKYRTLLQWTASKASLIELIYALQSTGVFNNGSADIKQLSIFIENVFSVDLGNVYNVFQEIRLRKKNRTSFIDQLKDNLTRRMDEADGTY